MIGGVTRRMLPHLSDVPHLHDPIHETRRLCRLFRMDGIKVMSCGISGGKVNDKICQYEKSRKSFFVLLRRCDNFSLAKFMDSSSFDKLRLFPGYEDI